MMATDIPLLKQVMKKHGWTNEKLAKAMDIHRDTLQRKMRGDIRFTAEDLMVMYKVIPLTNTELLQIFFNKKSQSVAAP